MRPLLLTAIVLASVVAIAFLSEVRAGKSATQGVDDFIFVTDDNPQGFGGCDAMSAVSRSNGRVLTRGRQYVSPGQLASTSDGSLVFAAATNNRRFLAALIRKPGTTPRWTSESIGIRIELGSAIGIPPQDEVVLLNTPGGVLEAHRIDRLIRRETGQPVGRAPVGQAADIVFSHDGRIAYVVATDGEIHVLHTPALGSVREPIEYPPVSLTTGTGARLRNTHASLSPDGRYLAINSAGPQVIVVGLETGEVSAVVAAGMRKTYGLAFNYAQSGDNDGALLAVHGRSVVAVYELVNTNSLTLVSQARVPPQIPPEMPGAAGWNRVATLAWTGSGDGLVVAIGGKREYRVLDFLPGAAELRRAFDFDACEATLAVTHYDQQFDVLTLHDRLHIGTPTATPSAPPTDLPSPPSTNTTEPTIAREPSRTPTPTETGTATTRPTSISRPLSFPLLLKERCTSDKQRVDVALVIDASSSMTEDTSLGRPKLTAAIEAAVIFVDLLKFDAGDQAAIVAFNADAWLAQELTDDGQSLDRALDSIRTNMQTCLVCGVDVAADELAGERRDRDNTQVMIVLTDGLSNPRPASEAVRRAVETKADGVVIYTVGLGDTLDFDALTQIASRPEYFYLAPDAEELAGIYQQIAVEIPCPPEAFWGGR
jgi:Mg-chelatase subunit ChlD